MIQIRLPSQPQNILQPPFPGRVSTGLVNVPILPVTQCSPGHPGHPSQPGQTFPVPSTPRRSVVQPFFMGDLPDPKTQVGKRVVARSTIPYQTLRGEKGTVTAYHPDPGIYEVTWDRDNLRHNFLAFEFVQWFSVLDSIGIHQATSIEKPCHQCKRNCTQGDRSCWWCGTEHPC